MRAGMLGPREREAGRASEDPSTGAALPVPLPEESRPPAESETADVGVLRNQEMVWNGPFRAWESTEKPWQCVWPAGQCCCA